MSMHATDDHASFTDPARRWPGILLAGVAALAVLAMAHHPVAHGDGDAMARIAHVAPLTGLVHGVLIGLLMLLLVLMDAFARHRVASVAWARAGFVAYAAGSAAWVLAGLINGFAVPAVAVHAPTGAHDWVPMLHFAWELNQAASGFGCLACAAGIALWSVDLAHRRGAARALGFAGLAVALGIFVAIVGMRVPLDVGHFGAIVLAICAWQFGAGLVLARPRLA